MIIGIGIDRVKIARIELLLAQFPNRFINRILSTEEQKEAGQRCKIPNFVAKRFAAKEAIAKALGTGIGHFLFTDLMVFNDINGKPYIVLSECALHKLKSIVEPSLECHWHISLVDEDDTAMAFVVLEVRNAT